MPVRTNSLALFSYPENYMLIMNYFKNLVKEFSYVKVKEARLKSMPI